MSAGAFVISKYETDLADVVAIKLQPETISAVLGTANAAPAGALSAGFPSAQVRRGRRSIGINARTVSIRLAEAPTGYAANSILRVPVLTKARFDALSRGSSVTYLDKTGVVVGKSSERIV